MELKKEPGKEGLMFIWLNRPSIYRSLGQLGTFFNLYVVGLNLIYPWGPPTGIFSRRLQVTEKSPINMHLKMLYLLMNNGKKSVLLRYTQSLKWD